MIAFFAMWLFVLTFIAGYLFAHHPLLGFILLSLTAISSGALTAFLQTERLPDDEDQ